MLRTSNSTSTAVVRTETSLYSGTGPFFTTMGASHTTPVIATPATSSEPTITTSRTCTVFTAPHIQNQSTSESALQSDQSTQSSTKVLIVCIANEALHRG